MIQPVSVMNDYMTVLRKPFPRGIHFEERYIRHKRPPPKSGILGFYDQSKSFYEDEQCL